MASTEQGVVLRLSRRFEAPRPEVFEAWTSEDVLERWWSAFPAGDTPVAEADVREGGRYRLAMRDPDSGQVHTLVGEYTEVRPPERLAFTWTWESNPEEMRGSAETLVEVDFREDGDVTEVIVTHSGFAGEEIKELHAHGWNGCLDNLERRVFPPR